jgi:hypothetical protein
MRLGATFDDLTETTIPESAWWAIDYHLDWLAAAVIRFLKETPPYERKPSGIYAAEKLVTGTQEDVDLIVAFGTTVILVEAKGDTAWSAGQFGSKVQRIGAIQAIAGDLVRLHHVLLSPRSTSLAGANATVPWISMACPDAENLWRVMRCDLAGKPSRDGRHFRIV